MISAYCYSIIISSFFFNDTATTEIYTYGHTLSLHDALPICAGRRARRRAGRVRRYGWTWPPAGGAGPACRDPRCAVRAPRPRRRAGSAVPARSRRPACARSEEHTSELQSLMRISYAVFCLKKKNIENKYDSKACPCRLNTHERGG